MEHTLLATLTFGTGGNARPQLGEGWARDEPDFVWSTGDTSRLTLPRPVGPMKYLLQMRVFPFLFAERVPQQRLVIEVNGERVANHSLTRATDLECEVPEHVSAENSCCVVRGPMAASKSGILWGPPHHHLQVADRAGQAGSRCARAEGTAGTRTPAPPDSAPGVAGVPLDHERKFAIRLGLTAIGALLAKLDLTPQKPLQRAYQRDPEAIERWRRETLSSDCPPFRARAVAYITDS